MTEELAPTGVANELGQALEGFNSRVSADEYAEHAANAVANGLEALRLVKVIEVKSMVGQVHLRCRVKMEDEREFVHGPVNAMLHRLSGVAETFFGKEFFLHGESPKKTLAPHVPAPEVSASHERYAADLAEIIDGTDLAEVVEPRSAPGQLHFLCRVKKDDERAFVHGPVKAMALLLKNRADTFFGKEFFLKNNKMVYAWNVSFGAEDLHTAATTASYALQNFRQPELVFQKDDPKLVYSWVTSFGAEDLEGVVRAVSEALVDFGPKLIVTEAPLLGPGTPVGSLATKGGGSKGASPIR